MRHDALGAPHVSTDTVCTLPDHRCYDKRRWQHVTSSEASVLFRPQALRRWNESTPFFRAVFSVLLYPLFPAYHRTYGPHDFLIGLFRGLKWAARSLFRARYLILVYTGAGILGQGNTPLSRPAMA